MSAKENEETVRRFYQTGASDVSVLKEVFLPNYKRNDLRDGQAGGPEGQQMIQEAIKTAFPDKKTTLNQLIATDEFVVGRWTMEATNTGPWGKYQPTGKKVVYQGVNIFRFENGKIAEIWNFRDDYGAFLQLGVPIHGGVPDF